MTEFWVADATVLDVWLDKLISGLNIQVKNIYCLSCLFLMKKYTMSIKTLKSKSATSAANATGAVSAKPDSRTKTVKAAAPVATRSAGRRAATTAQATPVTAKKTVAPRVPRKSARAKSAPVEPAFVVQKDSKKAKPGKVRKPKLIRDSFTMPDVEYVVIAALKKRCLNVGVSAKKSEILRAAVANLARLSDRSVLAALRRLEVIKTGRPAKGTK